MKLWWEHIRTFIKSFAIFRTIYINQLIKPLNANHTEWSNTLKQLWAVADEFFECI